MQQNEVPLRLPGASGAPDGEEAMELRKIFFRLARQKMT